MNNRSEHRHRALLQNLAITLLTVSAVVLFVWTQLDSLTSDISRWKGLFQMSATENSQISQTETAQVSAPVRLVVSGAYGRYGNLTLTTADESFVPLGNLLGEALGSARTLTVSSEEAFFEALSRPSIYFDFCEALPLSVLSEGIGVSGSNESTVARRLVVSAQEDGVVRLDLWGERFFTCTTAVTEADLTQLIEGYELGGARFAFDSEEENPPLVAPCSLLLTQLPQLAQMTVSNPLTDTDSLLTALGFNPHTNYRNTESNGTEVIVENDQTLRIAPDGTVRYTGTAASTLHIADGGDTVPTLRQAASGTSMLLNHILANRSGVAALYLQSIEQSGAATTLRFGYHIGGVPVHFADGESAVEVTLTSHQVTSLTIRFRQYTAQTHMSLLLPVRQALAIAAEEPNGELVLGYVDNGGDDAAATWLRE